MNETHQGNSKSFYIVLGAIFFVAIVWFYINNNAVPSQGKDSDQRPFLATTPDYIDTTGWEIYTNKEFGFTLRYPSDWEVAAFPDYPIAPRFHVYKKTSDTQITLPFDHFSEVSNVTIFPKGIPTEGVSGETKISQLPFTEKIASANDYVLRDTGEAWGTMVRFLNPPPAWNDSGFVWARAQINDLDETCIRNGQEISLSECDPIGGDHLIKNGSVDPIERAIEEKILGSITFTDAVNNLIHITSPEPNGVIISPLTVSGEARGSWYAEGNFPLIILDENGEAVATGYAEARRDWMTEDLVPFVGTITFIKPQGIDKGFVLARKANPSGLPENGAEALIPVYFGE